MREFLDIDASGAVTALGQLYEITRSDGSTSRMRLLDPNTTIEAEIAKWHPDDHGTVTGWKQISEAIAREPAPPPEIDLTGVPDTIRDVLLQMGSAMAAMQAELEALRQQTINDREHVDAIKTDIRATLKS